MPKFHHSNYILAGVLLSKQIFHLRVKNHIHINKVLCKNTDRSCRGFLNAFTGKANNINFTRDQKPTRNLNHFKQVTEQPTKLMFDILNMLLYSALSRSFTLSSLITRATWLLPTCKVDIFNHNHPFALLILTTIFTSSPICTQNYQKAHTSFNFRDILLSLTHHYCNCLPMAYKIHVGFPSIPLNDLSSGSRIIHGMSRNKIVTIRWPAKAQHMSRPSTLPKKPNIPEL